MTQWYVSIFYPQSTIGKKFTGNGSGGRSKEYEVSKIDNFSYTDPVDGSVTTKQGIRIFFKDGSRIVFRLSGTGSSGATVRYEMFLSRNDTSKLWKPQFYRLYVDSYENDSANFLKSADEMLSTCVDVALQISKLKEFTGRDKPTVIT